MRFCARQARAEFALFSRLRTTRGTTHRQGQSLFDFHRHNPTLLLADKMVNSDHSASPPSVNTGKRQILNPALGDAPGSIWQLAPCYRFYRSQEYNAATDRRASQASPESRRSSVLGARGCSGSVAVKAAPAEPNRGNRELSSAAVW